MKLTDQALFTEVSLGGEG